MANQQQLDRLQAGVSNWNEWRKNNDAIIDLSGANLSGANLSRTYLGGANLEDTNLSSVNLISADLFETDLSGANLEDTNLSSTNFEGANLSRANLSRAKLNRTYLSRANLEGANLGYAMTYQTTFNDLDLRKVKGLKAINHQGPSGITTSTLERSQGEIPESFLRGAGLSDTFIEYARSLVQSPIQYYTCFISYSSKNQDFAERIYADLQSKGVRCWYAPEDLKIGDYFAERIEQAIRTYDKLMVILSEHSVSSSWVEDEVRAAQEKEERFKREQALKKTVLFPVKIDEAIEEVPNQWAARLRRQRHIGDFIHWKDHDSYQKAFQRLLRDLKADTAEQSN